MDSYELITNYRKLIERAPDLREDIQSYQEPFLFLVNGNPTMIGDIRLSKMDIYINNLFSLEPRKGNGRVFIDYLKNHLNDHGAVTGESTVSAFPFWKKMGATFNSTILKHYEHDKEISEHLEEGGLLPFMLYKQPAKLS